MSLLKLPSITVSLSMAIWLLLLFTSCIVEHNIAPEPPQSAAQLQMLILDHSRRPSVDAVGSAQPASPTDDLSSSSAHVSARRQLPPQRQV